LRRVDTGIPAGRSYNFANSSSQRREFVVLKTRQPYYPLFPHHMGAQCSKIQPSFPLLPREGGSFPSSRTFSRFFRSVPFNSSPVPPPYGRVPPFLIEKDPSPFTLRRVILQGCSSLLSIGLVLFGTVFPGMIFPISPSQHTLFPAFQRFNGRYSSLFTGAFWVGFFLSEAFSVFSFFLSFRRLSFVFFWFMFSSTWRKYSVPFKENLGPLRPSPPRLEIPFSLLSC